MFVCAAWTLPVTIWGWYSLASGHGSAPWWSRAVSTGFAVVVAAAAVTERTERVRNLAGAACVLALVAAVLQFVFLPLAGNWMVWGSATCITAWAVWRLEIRRVAWTTRQSRLP